MLKLHHVPYILLLLTCFVSNTRAQCVEPTSFTRFRGVPVDEDLSYFLQSDDIRAIYWPGFTLVEAPITLIFDGKAPKTTHFAIEARARTPGLTFFVEVWNPNLGWFEEIGFDNQSVNVDAIVELEIDPILHVDTNGAVRARIGWKKTGFTVAFPWQVEVDWFAFCGDE